MRGYPHFCPCCTQGLDVSTLLTIPDQDITDIHLGGFIRGLSGFGTLFHIEGTMSLTVRLLRFVSHNLHPLLFGSAYSKKNRLLHTAACAATVPTTWPGTVAEQAAVWRW
jgi:hypothetical protein